MIIKKLKEFILKLPIQTVEDISKIKIKKETKGNDGI